MDWILRGRRKKELPAITGSLWIETAVSNVCSGFCKYSMFISEKWEDANDQNHSKSQHQEIATLHLFLYVLYSWVNSCVCKLVCMPAYKISNSWSKISNFNRIWLHNTFNNVLFFFKCFFILREVERECACTRVHALGGTEIEREKENDNQGLFCQCRA